MSKHHISWENIQEWSADIAHKIAADCPDINHMTLVAVSRGGLIPAQLIAYRLNIRDIRVMKLISYDSDNKRGETCLLYTSPSPRDVEESRMPSSA